jgi:hypothetical protein
MKRRMVLIGLLALLMLFAVVAPVMAKAEKVPVAGLSFITPTGAVPPERDWETGGGIDQYREAFGHGYNCYWINNPLPSPPWIPPVNLITGVPSTNPNRLRPDYLFYATAEISGMANDKADVSVSHWKAMMVYPIPYLGAEQGRFEGIMTVKSDGVLTTMHCVYQGSGIFDGQTLQVSGTKLSGQPGVIEGFLLTR